MTDHVWINGPDGQKMHCVICGVSRVEHFADSCEGTMEWYVKHDFPKGRTLEWKRDAWIEYRDHPESRRFEVKTPREFCLRFMDGLSFKTPSERVCEYFSTLWKALMGRI